MKATEISFNVVTIGQVFYEEQSLHINTYRKTSETGAVKIDEYNSDLNYNFVRSDIVTVIA